MNRTPLPAISAWLGALANGGGTPADLAGVAEVLNRLAHRLAPSDLVDLSRLAHGRSLDELAQALRDAVDPEAIRAAAELLAANERGCACSGEAPPEPTHAQIDQASERLVREAFAPFVNNPAWLEWLRKLAVAEPV